MSTDEDSLGSAPLPTAGERTLVERDRERTKGGRNADLMRHQQSFEARYSSMIQQQIWETTINKDVMERQLNAYFPFARSASLNKDGSDGFYQQLLTPTSSGNSLKTRSLATTPTRQRSTANLEKSDTLDVAELQPVESKGKP